MMAGRESKDEIKHKTGGASVRCSQQDGVPDQRDSNRERGMYTSLRLMEDVFQTGSTGCVYHVAYVPIRVRTTHHRTVS